MFVDTYGNCGIMIIYVHLKQPSEIIKEMSDSETDSDLNVSRYHPEDNLNIYGSPIYAEQPQDKDAGEEQTGPSTVVFDPLNIIGRSQVS